MNRRPLAALLTAALLLCLCGCAQWPPAPPEEPTPEPPLPTVTLEPAPSHMPETALRVYYDGMLADRGYVRDGTVFLDPAPLCAELELEESNVADVKGFTLQAGSLAVTGERGKDYFCAGERYLFAPEGWMVVDGRAYLSAEVLSRIFGANISATKDLSRVDVSTRGARLMDGSDALYHSLCSDEEIFWLTHIISAEAGTQPLAGQIGVGNVIFNRVADPYYPDKVLDVIFQKGERAQFDPVDDGSINRGSFQLSLIAVYLCLEGYNTVGQSEFFVNPDTGNAAWFEANRTFVVRIGDHEFYA